MRGPSRSLFAAAARVVVVAVAVVVLAGCQVKVAIDTTVNKDGSGTVSVAVGLDAKALARVGDPNTDLQTADLKAAGWTVSPAVKEPDGLTWVRASKPFADPDQLTKVLTEVVGPSGMLQGYRFTRTETDQDITYALAGTIDTTKGLAAFADPDLAAKLGGDPFGGNVAVIEAEEGRPVADMVTFDITARIADGAPTSYKPTLADKAPIPVAVSTVEEKPPPVLQTIVMVGIGVLVVLAVLAGLVAARRRFRA